MKAIQRLFKKKINGEELENLIIALGENPRRYLQTLNERWSTREVYGKTKITPIKEGLKVDLDIIRTDYHRRDGTIGLDNIDYQNPFNFNTSDEIVDHYLYNIMGIIRYNLPEENKK